MILILSVVFKTILGKSSNELPAGIETSLTRESSCCSMYQMCLNLTFTEAVTDV